MAVFDMGRNGKSPDSAQLAKHGSNRDGENHAKRSEAQILRVKAFKGFGGVFV